MAEPEPASNVASASAQGASPAGKPGAVESIELGPKLTLLLEADALAILDKTSAKSSRSSCASLTTSANANTPGTRSIPFYNILWAELSPDSHTVTIDFAQETSKNKLRASKLVLPATPPSSTPPEAITAFLTTLLARSYGRAQQRKRAYVLVNPNAGPGGADRLFATEARPIFEAARMALTVVTTAYGGEAERLAEALDVDAHDVVVACSGDGLPYEVFNGLARRPDARRALARLPVVMVPCGSGNAMACNLYGTHRPSLAALAIVKGVDTPFDLVSITQGGERKLSFLSQSLGLIADLDILTEGMRWMGSQRFTVGFFWLLMQKKLYPCDIAVKVEIDHKAGVREHYKNKVLEADGGSPEEGTGGTGGQKSDRESEATRTTTAGQEDDGGLPPLQYGTVQDKLPEGWELIPHEKLWSFYCGNMAYMSPGLDFFPAALANDGLMDLVTIDGPMSVRKAIEIQLGVESGTYFDNPLVQYRKVSAYRVIPRAPDENGIVSIDGERFPFAPFQAEVHRALGRTLSKSGGYATPGPRHWDKVSVGERLLA